MAKAMNVRETSTGRRDTHGTAQPGTGARGTARPEEGVAGAASTGRRSAWPGDGAAGAAKFGGGTSSEDCRPWRGPVWLVVDVAGNCDARTVITVSEKLP